MSEIEVLQTIVLIGAIWYVWRRIERALAVLDGVVEAQSDFAPVVDRMGEMLDSVWESQETRKKVLADHERQAKEHAAMLQKLDDIKR